MNIPDVGRYQADEEEARTPPEPDVPVPAPFVITKEHRRFTEFADAVRRDRYIGLCYGPPGVGKTLSARQYAGWNQVAPYLDSFTLIDGRPVPESALTARTVVYTPEVYNTPRSVQKTITFYQDRLNYAVQLVHDNGLGGPDTAARFTTRSARNTVEEPIDTTAPDGDLVIRAVDATLQLQTAWIAEVTTEGQTAARARGQRVGSPPKLTPERADLARQMHAAGHPTPSIAAMLKVATSTIYRLVRQPPDAVEDDVD